MNKNIENVKINKNIAICRYKFDFSLSNNLFLS